MSESVNQYTVTFTVTVTGVEAPTAHSATALVETAMDDGFLEHLSFDSWGRGAATTSQDD